jgi:hypothetical protein
MISTESLLKAGAMKAAVELCVELECGMTECI